MRPFSYHDTTDTREASEGHRSVGTGLNNTGSRGLVDRPRSVGTDSHHSLGKLFPPFYYRHGVMVKWSPSYPFLWMAFKSLSSTPICLFTSIWLSLPVSVWNMTSSLSFFNRQSPPPPFFNRLFPPPLPSARSTLYRRGESPWIKRGVKLLSAAQTLAQATRCRRW